MERYNAALRRSAFRLAGALVGMVLVCGLFVATQRHLVSAVRTWMV
jgi:hypothetical protein